jgi:hypothetical protein
MRATVIHAPHDIRVEEVPDPAIQRPTDAVLRVLRACICGSDLWAYRGESARQPGLGGTSQAEGSGGGSSRSAAMRCVPTSPVLSAPPTSSPSAATRPWPRSAS